MRDTLDLPWQAALALAGEAYCAGTIPIGAMIADANDRIITRGHNRILDTSGTIREREKVNKHHV